MTKRGKLMKSLKELKDDYKILILAFNDAESAEERLDISKVILKVRTQIASISKNIVDVKTTKNKNKRG